MIEFLSFSVPVHRDKCVDEMKKAEKGHIAEGMRKIG